MFGQHQNGKSNRYKIRQREYILSKINFLEIKFKTNKGRTIKKRIKIQDEITNFSEREHDFLNTHSPLASDKLELKLLNHFKRITLVSDTERLTIDSDLSFTDLEGKQKSFPEIVVVELKQASYTLASKAMQAMKKRGVRPESFSKYCIGTACLNTGIKSNMFKRKLALVEKIKLNHINI